MSESLQFVIGLVLGLLVSIPISLAIKTLMTQARPNHQPLPGIERLDAELVVPTDERLAISKGDYLASVAALGDAMGSPDPYTRQLAANAYDAFKEAVKPA